jgi:hypothetical protein
MYKAYDDVINGQECGMKFWRMKILKEVALVPTEPMMLGKYFEYLITGYVPPGEEKPSPLMTKSGKPTAASVYVESQAQRIRGLIADKKLSFDENGIVLEHEISPEAAKKYDIDIPGHVTAKGVIDSIGTVNGERAIIDIKLSNMIRNKWEKTGWEEVNSKMYQMFQAIQYVYLMKKKTEENLPFYFLVANYTPTPDMRLFRFRFDNETLLTHEKQVLDLWRSIDKYNRLGWAIYIRPSPINCSKCELQKTCGAATNMPPIEDYEGGYQIRY